MHVCRAGPPMVHPRGTFGVSQTSVFRRGDIRDDIRNIGGRLESDRVTRLYEGVRREILPWLELIARALRERRKERSSNPWNRGMKGMIHEATLQLWKSSFRASTAGEPVAGSRLHSVPSPIEFRSNDGLGNTRKWKSARRAATSAGTAIWGGGVSASADQGVAVCDGWNSEREILTAIASF